MAFVVETGAGLANANAYITVAYFKTYHTDRGNGFSASDKVLEHNIIKATDYIDQRWRGKFVGFRENITQSLEWPRVSAFYSDGRIAADIPREVQQATAEYALRSLTGELAPDPVYDETNRPIREKEEQVGPISERVRYAGEGAVTSFRKYPLADNLLRELTYLGSELKRV